MTGLPRADSMNDCVKALILVGGPSRGTRFRPLSLHCPKPLFPIGGMPILHHHMQALSLIHGLRDVYLMGFFEDSVFKPYLDQVSVDFPKLNVTYLREYKPLGTGGGIHHFRDELIRDGLQHLFVIHSDIITSTSFSEMFKFHVGAKSACTVLTTKIADEATSKFGCLVIEHETGEVLHYVEKPEFFVSNFINAGVYLFDSSVFSILESLSRKRDSMDLSAIAGSLDSITESSENIRSVQNKPLLIEIDVLKKLNEKRKLFSYKVDGFWTRIKSAASAVEANSIVLQHSHHSLLASGNVIQPVFIHPSANVHPTAKIGPNVSIGKKVIVGAGARVRDCILLDNCQIKQYALVNCSVVGWNSVVGKWTRIEGTRGPQTLSKLMLNGQKTQAATVIGDNVTIADEIIVRNCLVLPNKELKSSYHNDILM